jgi:uncharacterized protein YukE
MDQNIAINTEVLENKIELLKSQRDRIKEVFDTQDKTTKKLPESWGGTNGEEAYERLTKHNLKYEPFINEIDERINFLQKIVDSYKKADVTISNKIDSNADVGA